MRRLHTLLPFVALMALLPAGAGSRLQARVATPSPPPAAYVLRFSFAHRTHPVPVPTAIHPPLTSIPVPTAVVAAQMPPSPSEAVATFPTAPPLNSGLSANITSIPPTEAPPGPTHTPTLLGAPSPTSQLLPSVTPPPPTATPPPPTAVPAPSQNTLASALLRDRIVAAARHYVEVKTRYRSGRTGPESFDCTGLVYRVFADCSAEALIGAHGEQGVEDYYRWFLKLGQADFEQPRVGDLIVYGDHVHIGIYVGNGRAISTLSAGVREHDAFKLRNGERGPVMAIKAYLHIEGK